jgi:chromate transporter
VDLLGAPPEALRGARALSDALSAITAAVVGDPEPRAVVRAAALRRRWERQVAGLTLLLPDPSTVSWPAVVLAAAAMLATFRWKLGMLWVLGGCAALGAAWTLAGGRT